MPSHVMAKSCLVKRGNGIALYCLAVLRQRTVWPRDGKVMSSQVERGTGEVMQRLV